MLIERTVFTFVDSDENRKWLHVQGVSMYMKKGWRLIASELRTTLELNNVQIQPPFQRKGRLREVLLAMQKQRRYDWLFIENVISPRLAAILDRHGWNKIIVGTDDRVPSYYRRLR